MIQDLFVDQGPPVVDYRPLLASLLQDAEMRAAEAHRNYFELSRKLVGLLTPDQIEAAKIAGCTPEVYAIEFIELAKDKLFPKFEAAVQPLSDLRRGF